MRAQIMLITIIIITILSILVVGVVGTAVQNVRQTVTSQQNEQILNAGESQLQTFIQTFGEGAALASLGSQTGCVLQSATAYECSVTDANQIQNVVTVRDTNNVEDFELGKDKSLDLNLVGSGGISYRGRIDMSWTGSAALEVSLYYTQAGAMRVITDIIDPIDIFDPSIGDSLNPALANHPFNFTYNPATGIYSFVINSIDGFALTSQPQFLMIVPRMINPGNIYLNVSGEATLPLQLREFIAVSHAPDSSAQVLTRVKAQIPLLPSGIGFLYSALAVQGAVSK